METLTHTGMQTMLHFLCTTLACAKLLLVILTESTLHGHDWQHGQKPQQGGLLRFSQALFWNLVTEQKAFEQKAFFSLWESVLAYNEIFIKNILIKLCIQNKL